MGPADDPLAAVDASLRVRGVNGLRVVDASVMPDIVGGNINAAVLMIAEKAADMISRRFDDRSGTSGPTARSTRGQQGIDMPVTMEVSSTGDAAFTQNTIRSSTESRKRT